MRLFGVGFPHSVPGKRLSDGVEPDVAASWSSTVFRYIPDQTQCFQFGRTVLFIATPLNHGEGMEGRGEAGGTLETARPFCCLLCFLERFLAAASVLLWTPGLRPRLAGLVAMSDFWVSTAVDCRSESLCSWQHSWLLIGCGFSMPSSWVLQKEFGHSWQKASDGLPHTSQWCQGQSQRPDHINTNSEQATHFHK